MNGSVVREKDHDISVAAKIPYTQSGYQHRFDFGLGTTPNSVYISARRQKNILIGNFCSRRNVSKETNYVRITLLFHALVVVPDYGW